MAESKPLPQNAPSPSSEAAAPQVQRLFSADEREAINRARSWLGEKKGDKIVGRVLTARKGGKVEAEGGYGLYPVVIVETIAEWVAGVPVPGEKLERFRAVQGFRSLLDDWLRQKLKSRELKLGATFVVSYRGIVHFEDEKKQDYHDYYCEMGDGSAQPGITDDELADLF